MRQVTGYAFILLSLLILGCVVETLLGVEAVEVLAALGTCVLTAFAGLWLLGDS